MTGPGADVQPVISVVVPTYRRPASLTQLLVALRAQRYPREQFELVLVNDDSDHPIDDIVAGFRDALDITLLDVSHRGCGSARQAGVLRARGRWLAFTDDDCRPAPDWLAQLDAAARSAPGAAIGGTVVNGLKNNLFSEATQCLLDALDARLNAGEAVRFYPTNNLTFPADDFRAIGGMNTAWPATVAGEDRELCARWVASGRRIVRAAQCIVHHHHALTARTFARQHFFYGRGARFFRDRLGNSAPPLEALGFYLGLPVAPLRHDSGSRGVALAALLVLAQAANMLGYARQASIGTAGDGAA